MMDDAPLLTRDTPDAMLRALPGDGRRIDLRLLSWRDVAEHTAEGIRERFLPGAFAGTDPATVTLESQNHRGAIVGNAESIEERDDGAYATFIVAPTPAGDELLTLARQGILRAASVVFRPITSRLNAGVVERLRVELARVAVLDRGAYPSAAVLAVRSAPEGDPAMTDVIEPIDAQPAPPPAQTGSALAWVRDRVADHEGRLQGLASDLDGLRQRQAVLASAPVAGSLPTDFEGATTLGELFDRGRSDRDLLARALAPMYVQREWADNLSSESPGLVRPTFITELAGIVNLGRPAITAFGPRPAGETGMSAEWPYKSTSNTVVAIQASEKTEIQSAKVSFAKGSANLATYAGGSDISLQTWLRSSPSYREFYAQELAAGWAAVTDAAFCTALVSGGTAASHAWIGDATGLSFRQSLFAASVQVETATGAPAEFVLAATDVFVELGGLTQIVPPTPTGNASNAIGTASAGRLAVDVSGLPVIHCRGLATGNVIVSNRRAAGWIEDGPRTIESIDVAKLGHDFALWSVGTSALFVAAGVVKLFGPGASGS